jgi:hypothetical protein
MKFSFVGADFWLGMSDLKPVQNQFVWVTSANVNTFTNWLAGQPVSDALRDNCGVIGVQNGVWYATSNCFQALPYICEIEVNADVNPHPSDS